MILSGSSHPHLAHSLSDQLHLPLASVDISSFPNGEKRIWVKADLKGKSVVVVQSFSEPVDEHIVEFCLLVDAAVKAGAAKIIALVPWFGYSPQDKLFRPGEPISAQVVAKLLGSVGIHHFVTVDIHSAHVLKYFSVPTTEITALPIFTQELQSQPHTVVIALDSGALGRSQALAASLKLPLVAFTKIRDLATGNISFSDLAGDVTGQHVISFDDFISTGSTVIEAAAILKNHGVASYTQCVTHALLAGSASSKLQSSAVDRLLVTDSYPVPAAKQFPKLSILPIAPLLAKAITPLLQ